MDRVSTQTSRMSLAGEARPQDDEFRRVMGGTPSKIVAASRFIGRSRLPADPRLGARGRDREAQDALRAISSFQKPNPTSFTPTPANTEAFTNLAPLYVAPLRNADRAALPAALAGNSLTAGHTSNAAPVTITEKAVGIYAHALSLLGQAQAHQRGAEGHQAVAMAASQRQDFAAFAPAMQSYNLANGEMLQARMAAHNDFNVVENLAVTPGSRKAAMVEQAKLLQGAPREQKLRAALPLPTDDQQLSAVNHIDLAEAIWDKEPAAARNHTIAAFNLATREITARVSQKWLREAGITVEGPLPKPETA